MRIGGPSDGRSMESNCDSELLVIDALRNLGLRAERFPKPEQRVQHRKTPDFRVFSGPRLEFFCEVKEITDADPVDDHAIAIAPGIKRAEQFGDSRSPVNRVVRKVEEAIAQFDSVDPEHKELRALALVNTYDLAGPDILEELVYGFQKTDSGTRFVTTPDFIRQRMATLVREIDFYWWLESHAFAPKTARIASHPVGSATFLRLQSLFTPRSGE